MALQRRESERETDRDTVNVHGKVKQKDMRYVRVSELIMVSMDTCTCIIHCVPFSPISIFSTYRALTSGSGCYMYMYVKHIYCTFHNIHTCTSIYMYMHDLCMKGNREVNIQNVHVLCLYTLSADLTTPTLMSSLEISTGLSG